MPRLPQPPSLRNNVLPAYASFSVTATDSAQAPVSGPAFVTQILVNNASGGSFTLLSVPMTKPRSGQTATLFNTGKVLIAGGEGSTPLLAPPEIYDPDTGAFTPTGALVTPGYRPALAVLLSDGTVLVVGGESLDPSNPTPKYAELFDPTTGTFSETGSLQVGADIDAVMTALGKSSAALALVTGENQVAQLYQ